MIPVCPGSSSGIKVWDCVHHYCTHNLRPSGGLVGLLTFHPDPAHLTLFSSTATDTSIKVFMFHFFGERRMEVMILSSFGHGKCFSVWFN